MDVQQPALDETIWSGPELLAGTFWQRLTSNSVYPYFSMSPFFDITSNNNVINIQRGTSEAMWNAYHNRDQYEAYLRSVPGLEFMVIEDPTDNGVRPDDPGMWVIRKQIRKNRDEVTPISCYIMMGDHIIMAPSLADVLSSRLISTMPVLDKLASTVSTLPIFTPAVGHTWSPPTAKPLAAAINARPDQVGKDDTPIPGSPAPSVNGSKSSLALKANAGSDYQQQKLLYDTYEMCEKYGDEYMDENPLVGEPGNFRINKVKEVAVPKPVLSIQTPFSAAVSGKSSDSPVASKKAKTGEKTPISAGAKEKKSRRKSKAAGATATTTPK